MQVKLKKNVLVEVLFQEFLFWVFKRFGLRDNTRRLK